MEVLDYFAARVESTLSDLIIDNGEILNTAIRYSLLGGGKRLRAALVYCGGELLSVEHNLLDIPAASIECIHCYSLIHDDLPAMDDDDYRRGKLSCHKKFGEDQAILAADALNTFAFEILSSNKNPLDDRIKIAQIYHLAQSAGLNGMVLGQSLDMIYTNKKIAADTLEKIHRHKTGDLIRTALVLGALSSKDYPQKREVLEDLGNNLGLAYQVIDDVLDYTSDSSTLGKTAGKDLAQNKNTFVNIFGLEKSQEIINSLYIKCLANLEKFKNTDNLRKIIDYLFHRSN